jgi:hypothetical protein
MTLSWCRPVTIRRRSTDVRFSICDTCSAELERAWFCLGLGARRARVVISVTVPSVPISSSRPTG